MELLYIIGNGFDIAQNLNTRFQDFLECYIKLPSGGSVAVSAFKSSISEGIETWADFEKQFGRYTSNFYSIEEYQEVIDDVRDNLDSYLSDIQGKFQPSEEYSKKILSDFFAPHQYLQPFDRDIVLGYFNDNRVNVNVVSFNYTNSLEKIFGKEEPPFYEKISFMGSGKYISSLIHIHGTLGNTILLGVNDVSQIANENLAKFEEVQNELIKPEANEGMHNTINRDVEYLINRSHLIVLFGTSIGETDNKWWQLIGERLKVRNTSLIYFVKSDYVFNKQRAFKYGLECQRQKDYLCDRLKIPVKSEIRGRIVISPNSDFFTFKEKATELNENQE